MGGIQFQGVEVTEEEDPRGGIFRLDQDLNPDRLTVDAEIQSGGI